VADPTAVIFDYYETLARLPDAVREPLFDDVARRAGADLAAGEAYRHWRERTANDRAVRFGGQRPPLDGAAPPFVTFRETWLQRFEQLFRLWGVDAPPALGADACRDAHAEAGPYPDAVEALESLRGSHRLAVLSDADRDFLSASVERSGLAFEAVVASEDVEAYKPHVSMFREGCARLGVEPAQAVYVGDSPWADIAGARNAGLRAVWMNRHGAEWPEDIEPPELAITTLEELPALLAQVP
jgi:2-haloalkanoic acid dehalogenase type II